MPDLSATEEKLQRIRFAIAAIPPGEVASYAEVARRAGIPRGARLAVRALRGSDADGLPWHRVLRADGRIAFVADSPEWREQVARLRAEGVRVERGRVRMPAPASSLDALLWAPR